MSSYDTIASAIWSPRWATRVFCPQSWKNEASLATPRSQAVDQAMSPSLVGRTPRASQSTSASPPLSPPRTFTLRVQLTTSASGNTESTTEALKGRTSGSALLLSRQRAGLVKKGSPFYDSFGGLLRDSRTPSCAFTQVELGQGCRATFRLRLPKQSYTGSRQEETHQPNQRRSRCQW